MAARKESGAAANANSIVQEAVHAAIRKGGEIGLQVAAYVDGERVVDVWGGLADETTGRTVNGDTLFPVFSVTKAVTATALHIQAERGLVDYDTPSRTIGRSLGRTVRRRERCGTPSLTVSASRRCRRG